MKRMLSFMQLATACAATIIAAGCAANPSASPLQNTPRPVAPGIQTQGPFANGALGALVRPSLIAVDGNTGALESWPIRSGGGTNPQVVVSSFAASPLGMIGNGHVVAAANQYPPEIVLYNFDTKRTRKLPDPFGTPIDLAIDKNAVLYAMNVGSPVGNIAMYTPGSPQPKELSCKYINLGEAIAVDNEGDIFVNGYGPKPGYVEGVVEIPNGAHGPEPQNCFRLNLKSEPGYVAGVGVDPKTDDLIVLDDPDLCAGGIEGRMTIYPKPYQRLTGRSHDLGANCAGFLRLNAGSTLVFIGDQDVSGSFTFVLQFSYPNGAAMGMYNGGQPAGFTTIPNTLPN